MTGKWLTRLIFVLILVSLVAGIRFFGRTYLGQTDSPDRAGYAFDGFAMGTVLSLKVYGADKSLAETGSERAMREVHRLHKVFDPHDPDSEVSRLNGAGPDEHSLPISVDMSAVLAEALRIRKLSGGLFEPALGELIWLWGFSEERKEMQVPDSSAIRALVDSSAWEADLTLSADGREIELPMRRGKIDLGAIAKGYAVDRALAVLSASGLKNALVNLGGQIGVLGAGANGRSWHVGVQHPRKPSLHIGAIDLEEGLNIATSGDYERYFFDHGRRYHHILDPRTGYSADQGVVGVTIVASTGLEADGLSTTVFILGPAQGIKLLDSLGVQGLIVYAADGATESGNLAYTATPGFLKLMKPDLDGLPIQ